MKNFRILFVLLFVCSFFILNAQTSSLQKVTNKICSKETTISLTKSINPPTPPKKSLAVTKQRRLKSYQNNHKIARKRKTVNATDPIATID